MVIVHYTTTWKRCQRYKESKTDYVETCILPTKARLFQTSIKVLTLPTRYCCSESTRLKTALPNNPATHNSKGDTMQFNDDDIDLKLLLSRATDDELAPLLDAILGEGRKGRISSELDRDPIYQKYPTNPTKYWEKIGIEIQTCGGNSFMNFFRDTGVTYREIVKDVADRLKVNYHSDAPTPVIEEHIFEKILTEAWSKMSDEEKETLFKKAAEEGVKIPKGAISVAAIRTLLKMGGFKSYHLMLIVANALWRPFFHHELRMDGLPCLDTLTKILSGFLSSIGWVITGIWTLLDLAGPAYRVTIPAVFYIAILRRMQAERLVIGE